jgi:hypothetical protein
MAGFGKHLVANLIVKISSSDIMTIRYPGRITVIFKPSTSAEVQDWITPSQVEIVRVTPPAERLEWLAQRAKELKETMGPRYLCHEKNRVRRLDGRSYRPHEATRSNVRPMQRSRAKEAA